MPDAEIEQYVRNMRTSMDMFNPALVPPPVDVYAEIRESVAAMTDEEIVEAYQEVVQQEESEAKSRLNSPLQNSGVTSERGCYRSCVKSRYAEIPIAKKVSK